MAEELIEHEKRYFSNREGIATFTIDGSIVPSLYVVSIKCRDQGIRRRAIELLLQNPRREGLWDSALIARVGMLSIQVDEEGGLVDGFVPDWARIVGVIIVARRAKDEGHINLR